MHEPHSLRSLFATALSFAVTALPAAAGAANVDVPSEADATARLPLETVRERHLKAINVERRAYGHVFLKASATLDEVAQAYAEDMLRRDYFGHTSPDGETVVDRASAVEYRWRRLAENLALDLGTPEETVAQWLDSPVHRVNLLNPRLTEVGLGLATCQAPEGLRLAWVEVLALPRSQPSKSKGSSPRLAASPWPRTSAASRLPVACARSLP
jgi:uncharacterized protein YkwD